MILKAVIFDMDGVIVDTEPLHRKAYYAMFEEVGIEVSLQMYHSYPGQSTIQTCRNLVDHFGLNQAPEELVAIKRKHFKHFFQHDHSLELIDGVLDLIINYYENGLKLVVASSSSMPNIHRIFERFDLNPYFSGKFSGADLKQSKPHPEIFEKAAEFTGYEKANCMVIEDSTNGILAASAAGIYCVGFSSPHSDGQDFSKADRIIKDYKEIYYHKCKAWF